MHALVLMKVSYHLLVLNQNMTGKVFLFSSFSVGLSTSASIGISMVMCIVGVLAGLALGMLAQKRRQPINSLNTKTDTATRRSVIRATYPLQIEMTENSAYGMVGGETSVQDDKEDGDKNAAFCEVKPKL